MRDILLFASLWDRADDVATVLALLAELRALPARRRVPWFAALPWALAHREPRVRAAALGALTGADGTAALAAFVDGLDDDDPDVRGAALEALRELESRDPMRWAHAVFHPRADVRRATLRVAEDELPSELCFYLLADEACRDLLLPRLGRDGGALSLAVPRDAFPAIVAFWTHGVLSASDALRLLEVLPVTELLRSASLGPVRPPAHVAELLGEREPTTGSALSAAMDQRDAFDALFAIMAAAGAPSTGFVRALAVSLLALPEGARRRALASVRCALSRAPRCDALALLWVSVDARLLLIGGVPLSVRRWAASQLPMVRHAVPRLTPDEIGTLYDTLLPSTGPLDLPVLGGLVALERSYRTLFKKVAPERLVAAIAAAPRDAASILLVADGKKRGRAWLLRQLEALDAAAYGEVLAWLAVLAPADKLSFLDELEPRQALALVEVLIALEATVELKLNKRLRLVEILGHTLTADVDASTVGDRLFQVTAALLAAEEPVEHRLGRALFEHLAHLAGGEGFAMAMARLPRSSLVRLVALLPELTGLSYGAELALASVVADHPDASLAAWARSRTPGAGRRAPATIEGVARLRDATVNELATCPSAALEARVGPWLRTPTSRLAEALARREDATPSAEVCAALLGCHDEPALVARELERFASHDASFLARLDALAVRWETCRELPWLGSAWLWRWERHAFAVAAQLAEAPLGLLGFQRAALALPSELVRERVYRALGEALRLWSVRDVARIHTLVAGASAREVVALVVEQLDTEVGIGAASLYLGLSRAGVAAALEALPRVKALLPDLGAPVREVLERVVSAGGLVAHGRAPRRREPPPLETELAAVRASTSPEDLERWCRASSERVVQEAALRAAELGGDALVRVARLILTEPRVSCLRTLVESVVLWPEHPALDALRDAIEDRGERDAELAFRLCVAFDERGEAGLFERSLAVVAGAEGQPWFRPDDYAHVVARRGPRGAALALAASPQPHAYLPAVRELLTEGGDDPRVVAALRGFLLVDRRRLEELRLDAAAWLHRRGDALGFPLLLERALDPSGSYGALFKGLDDRYVAGAVDAVLLAGPTLSSELRMLQLLEPVHVSTAARDRAHERLLVHATLERTAERIMNLFASRGGRDPRRDSLLGLIAEVFAWGGRESLALTRRRLRVHMSEREALGYTRLSEERIWVSPLPILRGDPNAREVVEALILHEIGHHRYHRGADAEAVWREAERDGLHGLLNLVADEHLERNLRALDDTYGDRLKRLAAHAFRHAHRDLRVASLLTMLGHEAFEVLSGCRLGVAPGTERVRVESGKLLALMERRGMAFARFVRALRMGLGDRYRDPLVARALGLFPKQFKHYSMAQLYELTQRLRDLFGWEVSLVANYGGHETTGSDARERDRWGRGITDEAVQREVERIDNPRKRAPGAGAGDPNKLWVNVSAEESFDLIHNVQRVLPDPVRHREVAREVARHARTLRQQLERLGLASRPTPHRLVGKRLDRGRLTALVTRREPRVLIGREVVRSTDLFLGTIVDCSGSMEGQGNIDKARRFACLLSEAVRRLEGVDARFFGFTDSVIYDAGDARRCAAASLEAGGGNNDAAALYHVAEVAKRSRRKAKVLVMVSDGLPTECSTAALRALVARLTRHRMCVAQVAVSALEEVCFPHYIVLDGELDASVRRFGQVVAKLVSRALS